MKAVTGDVPSNDPIDIEMASMQYATVDPSKFFVSGSTRPENFAMAYKVLVKRANRHQFFLDLSNLRVRIN
jgi:hypothetical protein